MGLPVLQRHQAKPTVRRTERPAARADDTLSAFGTWPALPQLLDGAFTPFADIEETDDSYLLSIDLPGVAKDDIELTVSGRRLTVSGQRKETERVGILRRRTRSVGEFEYDVLLPSDIEEDGVTVGLHAGVLTVRAPKAASQRRRRIPVS